jgi:hypothetical protein
MRNLYNKIPGAPNFRYREFVRSQTATRLGINNVPGDKEWYNLEKLAVRVLQPVRNRFGSIKITSGFRSEELNTAIGGSKYSNHCRGEAADIEPVSGDIKLIEIIKFINDTLEFRTLIAEYFPEGWIHVDYREGGNLKRLKLKDKDHNYTEVDIDYLMGLYG